MKKILLYLLVTIMISSCGYKIAGFNTELPPAKFYINRVQNETIDTRLGEVVQQRAEQYFLKYGELSSYNNASYFMDIKISDLNYNNSILTATEEAISTEIQYDITIIITNVDGNEVFTWERTALKSFSINTDVAISIRNRDTATADALKDALEDFRVQFSKKIYK